MPLRQGGGFGANYETESGLHIRSMVGSVSEVAGVPRFGDQSEIVALVLHEFGHSFLPISEPGDEAIRATVQSTRPLFRAIAPELRKQGYITWEVCLEELVLRATVIDLLVRHGAGSADTLLAAEEAQGFAYIEAAYNALEQYHENRDLYPGFDRFIPVIGQALLDAYAK